jgi:hypothetical protein
MFRIRHEFQCSIPDDPAAAARGEILPSHWNTDLLIEDAEAFFANTGNITFTYDSLNENFSANLTSLSAFTTDDLTQGSVNKYYADGLARAAISGQAPINYNATTGVISLDQSGVDHGSLSGLSDDDHTQYHTDARALTWLGTRSTSDLNEGTNLYYTNERVDDRVAALIQNGTGITWTYNDAGNTLTGNVTITQYTDEMAQDAIGAALTDTSTIDFTYDDTANTITADVKTNSITNALFRQSAGLSVVGVTGNATANVADITAGSDGQVLRRSGTALGFGALNLASSAAITGTLPVANGGADYNAVSSDAGGLSTLTITTLRTTMRISGLGAGGVVKLADLSTVVNLVVGRIYTIYAASDFDLQDSSGSAIISGVKSGNIVFLACRDKTAPNGLWYAGIAIGTGPIVTSQAGTFGTLTSTGNIYLGSATAPVTTYPNSVTIKASTSGYAGLELYGNTTAQGGQIDLGGSATKYAEIVGERDSSGSGGQIILRTNNGSNTEVDRIKIDKNGNFTLSGLVGGGSAPFSGYSYTAQAPDINGGLLMCKNNSGTNKWHLKLQGTGLADLGFSETSVSDNRLVLKAGGNVGLGLSSPETQLHVGDSTTASAITLGVSSTTGGYTALLLSLSAVSGGYASIQAVQSAGTAYGNLALQRVGGSLALFGVGSFGSGVGVVSIANATTVPTSNPTGGGILYVQSGALKYRGSSGTVTTIANA